MITNGWIKIQRNLLLSEYYGDTNVVRLYFHLLLTANYEDKMWKGISVKAGSTIISWKKLSQQLGLSTQKLRTAMLKLEKSKTISRVSTHSYQIITLNDWHEMQGVENNNETSSSAGFDEYSPKSVIPQQTINNDKLTNQMYLCKGAEKQVRQGSSGTRQTALTKQATNFATNEQQNKNNQSTTIKENKKQKLKESKREVAPPSLESFEKFGIEEALKLKMTIDKTALRAKYYSWIQNDWKTGKNKKITNWKATLINTLPYIQKEKSSEKKEKIDFNQNHYTV